MLSTVSRAPLGIGLVAAPLAAEVVRIECKSLSIPPFANRIVTDFENVPRNANRRPNPEV
jgi:hypothetical protein